MWSIELLPAEYGDCIWIEWGSRKAPRRLLIDGGTHSTYEVLRNRIETLPLEQRVFELLVITHIDTDHIDGALRLLQNSQLGVHYKDIWFNAWEHLPGGQADVLGVVQGEYVSARIKKDALSWNQAFCGDAVMVSEAGDLPRIALPQGLVLTLLSPSLENLAKLRPTWHKVVSKAGLLPGATAEVLEHLERDHRYAADVLGAEVPDVDALAQERFQKDGSKANGSSIAFLAELNGRRCLLAGDAHADNLEDSIRRYLQEECQQTLRLDAFKLPHHGSKANLSPVLLDLIQCDRYLISTNGRRFDHPDNEAIARILKKSREEGREVELMFNYSSAMYALADEDRPWWENPDLKDSYLYDTSYQNDDEPLRPLVLD